MLLLDGLDEASEHKEQIFEYLGRLLAAEPSHFVVLTSRPGAVGNQDLILLRGAP